MVRLDWHVLWHCLTAAKSNSIRTDHIGRPVFAANDVGVKVWQATYLPFLAGA